MSDLGFNKIAFCVLGTALVLIGVNEASHSFFHTAHHEKDGYFVEVAEATSGSATPAEVEGPRDYLALISTANIAAGEEVAIKCKQCHSFEPGGEVITGPPLYDVVGRDVASLDSFKFTTGTGSLSEIEGVWDYEKLDHYLERPRAMAPGTGMNFVGLKKQADRANIIAWMRTLTPGEPYPLPEPLPPQEAEAPVEDAALADPVAPEEASQTPEPAPSEQD